jgi:CHRD domain-containing protein
MIKNRISNVILIIFFSVAITTIFILSGNKVLIFGQIHNEDNANNNNNNNINKNDNTILSGSQQVPPVKTNATGTASFEMLDDNKTLHYQINILDVPKITGIHIHQGKIGENGDIVVNLYNNSQQNIFLKENETKISQIASNSIKINGNVQSSFLASGTINNSDLKGPLYGKSISDLINLIKSKNAYVNVHSQTHPDGEIRGDI